MYRILLEAKIHFNLEHGLETRDNTILITTKKFKQLYPKFNLLMSFPFLLWNGSYVLFSFRF